MKTVASAILIVFLAGMLAGCVAAPAPVAGSSASTEENTRIVRRVFTEVFDKHNLAVVDELFAADFVYHAPGNPDFGREGLKEGFAAYLAAFPDARMTIEDIFAAGDRVAVRYTCRGVHKGEFMGVPPSGKEVTMSAILIHRLANGKMVEDWEWADNLGFMAQLGIVKLPQ